MRILLPPSEAKRPGGRRRPLGEVLGEDGWASARALVFAALAKSCAGPGAASDLALPPSVAHAAIQANRTVRSSPTMSALDRYRGVVYEGFDAASLSPAQRRAAQRTVLIFSGLFGVLTAAEPIPDYRVPAKARLPDIGVAGAFWRGQLTALMPQRLDKGLIVDLRSSDYQSMWRPPAGCQLVGVRVLTPQPGGRLSVVSYPSKLHKGRLARALIDRLAAGREARDADDVVQAWLDIGGADAMMTDAAGSRLDPSGASAGRLDLIQ